MSVRSYSADTGTPVTLVTTTEAVILTLPGVATYKPGEAVRLSAQATITTGAGTTSLTLRIRRDSLTGTVVNFVDAVGVEVAAGGSEDHNVLANDSFEGEVAGQVYVLTAQQAGATANGSAVNMYLSAETGY